MKVVLVSRYKGPWVRKRSNDNVIAEIQQARASFPTIEAVNIVDDLFFVRDEEDIEDFAVKYKAQVNLPLELDAFPNTISEPKVKALSRVPISLISMGIRSGSHRTLHDIYKRPTPIERIVEGIETFSKHRIRAEYHYIVSNPFEPEANLIYQPFIRPLKYLRRKPRYEELHPEDEVTLPRNHMGATPATATAGATTATAATAAARRKRAAPPGPFVQWKVPHSNAHAMRHRRKMTAAMDGDLGLPIAESG